MPPDTRRWQRIQEAFTGALEQPRSERASYLKAIAGEDPELLAEVEAMLLGHESLGPLAIEKRLLGADTDLSGTLVGSYRLTHLIATGGMGEVYEAEREGASFRQRVALKLLRHGLTGSEARLRFRQERQILARLVHPLVVPILDGGITQEGRPYLVLQYVDGKPLTMFCEQTRQSLEGRLRLFCDVARAVEHAHANLVVHRDLKPANVLVTADAQVRLLDFGVAKLLDPSADADLPVTKMATRVMTVDYAAPEQIQGEAITTATDVHALGVLLYELLTGRRPFVMDANGPTALERRILEEGPEIPSVVARQAKGEQWAKHLRGDLDTIVLKAMAKEPGQRYSSARDFAQDIGRFLSGEPILARKPSLRYRLEKFVRRNRLASAVAAISLLLLLAFAGMIWRQTQRVARERDIARSEQEKADRVVAMLVDLFSSADPAYLPGGRDLTIGEFLRTAETMLARQEMDPAVLARLRHALGKVYLARSQFGQARTHLESALAQLRRQTKENEDPASAAVVHDLARLAAQTRPKAEAVVLLRKSLDLHRRLYGENHPSIAQCMHDLANVLDDRQEKLALIENALALRRKLYPDGHISVAESLTALGVYHYEGGDPRRAEQEFEAAVDTARQTGPPGHPSALWAVNDLAVVRLQLGRFSEAEQLQRDLLMEKRRIHGDNTVPVAVVWGNLGTVLAAIGNYVECEEAFRTAQSIFVKLLGPDHVHVANATRNLARVRMFRGDYRESSQLFRQALDIHRKANGTDHGYWYMRGQAAAVTAGLGRATEAESELRLVLSELSALGVPPARKSDPQVALGFVLLDAGKAPEAETWMREALEARKKHMAPEHPAIAEAECGLGAALAAQGKPEGREMVRRSLPKYRRWGLAVYAPRLMAGTSHP